MKRLHGQATAVVAAPLADCLALVEAVDRYPNWHPEVVQEVDVLKRGEAGRAEEVRATLHVARGPLVKDVELMLAVAVENGPVVRLTRIPHHRSDEESFEVSWHLDAGRHTRIRLELDATLNVPRLLPLGGVGDSLADGFVAAAISELRSGTTPPPRGRAESASARAPRRSP
jgi:hypothetical protein